jgi:hypothetical protein
MNLEGLLDELRGNVLRDDAVLASGPNDQLWSDETLVKYINDGYTRFARRTLSLRDASTPEVVEVTLAAGVSTYDLHESILSVVSARYDTDTVDLDRIGRSLVNVMVINDPPWFDPSTAGELNPGRPRAFSTDETISVDTAGAVNMKVWPEPAAAENGKTVYLRVARKPVDLFRIDKLDQVCELPEEYQLDMLEWAAYRALRNSDIDGHKEAAVDHQARFEAAVAEILKDMRRKMFAPTTWRFGDNGYAWDTV